MFDRFGVVIGLSEDHKPFSVLVIEFFKSGKFCEVFGHSFMMVACYPEDRTEKHICKFCQMEHWT